MKKKKISHRSFVTLYNFLHYQRSDLAPPHPLQPHLSTVILDSFVLHLLVKPNVKKSS